MGGLLALIAAAVTLQAASPERSVVKLSSLSLTVSERYDSNFMLQNDGPLSRMESWVTSVQPVIGLQARPPGLSAFQLGLQYAPEFTFFHARDEESYQRHVGVFQAGFQDQGWKARAQARVQYTEGSTQGPLWSVPGQPGSIPALGGPEVRYRRRNLYWQSPLEARRDFRGMFVRGVFEARVWDILTDFRVIPGATYQNYMDRTDVNGGADWGIQAGRGWEPRWGYRFGHQDQERLPAGLPFTYQNDYHRVLAGLGASPGKWLTLDGEIGPSFHRFNPSTLPPGADPDQTLLYFQANATVNLSHNTALKITAYQHLLPSTAGRANFQNLRATATFEQRLTPSLRASLRFDLQEYDFVRGLVLRDQVFTVEPRVEYRVNSHLTLAAWYLHEWADARAPGTAGREYERHVVGLGVTVKR